MRSIFAVDVPRRPGVRAGPDARGAGLRDAILFAMGPAACARPSRALPGLASAGAARRIGRSGRHAAVSSPRLMWRMTRTGDRPASPSAVTSRLGASDVPALQALYADGESSGESPDFVFPSMVAGGVFHGIYEGTALVSAAGTHVLAREEGVAAIGNVYTRHDRRGRGLGRLVRARRSASSPASRHRPQRPRRQRRGALSVRLARLRASLRVLRGAGDARGHRHYATKMPMERSTLDPGGTLLV